MRNFALFVLLIVVSVSAKGSGPYLPSGWRPQGPTFFLPSEVEKPKESPVKDIIYQESEASGSDSFQEYGPPKVQEVSLQLSKQGLPDTIIEQSFASIEVKEEDIVENKVAENVAEKLAEKLEEQVEEKVEEKEQEVAVTEAQAIIEDSEANLSQQSIVHESLPVTESSTFIEGTTTLAETEVIEENIEPVVGVTTQFTDEVTDAVVTTEAITQQVTDITAEEKVATNEQVEKVVEVIQENENANSNIVSTFQERVQVEEVQTVKEEVQKFETEVKKLETEVQQIETQVQNFATEVKAVEQIVQNIPELLINLDNEIKQQQIENVQETDAKTVLQTFGSLEQAPEGFLEYGPPGFKEYGPPKEEALSAIAEVILPEVQSIETNVARRRRFSPKFRTTGKTIKH